jgi:hypothetical protein
MDWCRSNVYEIAIRAGELVELESGARFRGWLWILGLFAAIITPGRVFFVGARKYSENQEPKGLAGEEYFYFWIAVICLVLLTILSFVFFNT